MANNGELSFTYLSPKGLYTGCQHYCPSPHSWPWLLWLRPNHSSPPRGLETFWHVGKGVGGRCYFDKASEVPPFSSTNCPMPWNGLSKITLIYHPLFIFLIAFFLPNQHPPPSAQRLCARSLPCLRTWTSWLPLKNLLAFTVSAIGVVI